MPLGEGGPPEWGGERGATRLKRLFYRYCIRKVAPHNYAIADVYTYMAVNKMLNLNDFKHLQKL